MEQTTQTVQQILGQPSFENKVISALRLVSRMEQGSAAMDEDWFAQTVRGFINVVVEAAEGAARQTREMFFATIVPGILAEGSLPAILLRSSTTFLSLLGTQLVLEVPQPQQEEVSAWFAKFAGSYIEDLYQACMAPQSP